jgi:hypothetical protein
MSTKRTAGLAAAALVMAAVALAAPRVHAAKQVDPMGKGLVGLMLLSGEIVLSVEALAGVRNPWALAIPTVVAAGGGAVGGYFIDAKVKNAGLSVGLLAGGMALFFPSIVIAVAKTRFVAEKDLAEDMSVTVSDVEEDEEEPAPPPPEPEGTTAVLQIGPRGLSVGVPPVQMTGLYSDEELKFLARDQGVEYRLSVLNVAF